MKKIRRELPKVGTTLLGKFKGQEYKAKIVKDNIMPAGRAVKIAGKNYLSMTAAAQSITKHAANGWRFWKIH